MIGRWRKQIWRSRFRRQGDWTLALGPAAFPSHTTVPELAVQLLSQPLHFLGPTTAGPGMVCEPSQLGHKRKECRRLADEKPHVR